MGQGQSQQQQRTATPEPEMNEEERAQAQADVGRIAKSKKLGFPDRKIDARQTTGRARQAPRRSEEEAHGNHDCECSGDKKADGAGAGKQGESWMEKCRRAGRAQELELRKKRVGPPGFEKDGQKGRDLMGDELINKPSDRIIHGVFFLVE
jgi:hypothetical protein